MQDICETEIEIIPDIIEISLESLSIDSQVIQKQINLGVWANPEFSLLITQEVVNLSQMPNPVPSPSPGPSPSGDQTFFVQNSQPSVTYNYGWVQTNYQGDPDKFTLWFYY